MFHGGKPWVADHKHPHYQAARNAMLKGTLNRLKYQKNQQKDKKKLYFIILLVFNVDPDFTREGKISIS